MRIPSGLLFLLLPAIAAAQGSLTTVPRIPLTGFGGTSLGSVVLGVSRSADVEQLLDSLGGLGPRRDNDVVFIVGTDTMRPPELYTPPGTMNQLYFEDGILVMIVEGIPQNLPSSKSKFTARYPNARETHRESAWYELQIQVGDCVWLIAVFAVGDDQLQSDGYAYTCKTKE